MSITVHPSTVEGTTRAPGSKSLTHRAMFLTLVANGGTVADPLWSQDTRASHAAIKAYGAKTVATRRELVVRGATLGPGRIDAVNSGTTLRLATATAALCEGTTTLAGDDSLNQRPMGPLVDALEQLGAEAKCQGSQGRPPLEVTGPVTGGEATIDASLSSQFVSALLLAAPRMPEGLQLEVEDELVSRPYVDLTIRVLRDAGATVREENSTFTVPSQHLRPARVDVHGDYSAAAFPLVAGAITGGHVTVSNLPTDTGQGDERLPELIEAFGAPVERQGASLTVRGRADEPAELDLADNPDLFPALAVLAATVEGTTELTGAPHLREKESDRIEAVVEGLNALGVQTEALEGGARIQGGIVSGGSVDSRGDHRIQMAFLVAGLAAQQAVTVTGPPDAHAVSYPGFLDALEHLGAKIDTDGEQAAPSREVAP